MLTMTSIQEEFAVQRDKRIPLNKLIEALLEEDPEEHDIIFYLKGIWNTLILDAKEQMTPNKYYFYVISCREPLDLDYLTLLDCIANNIMPLRCLISLINKLDLAYDDLIEN